MIVIYIFIYRVHINVLRRVKKNNHPTQLQAFNRKKRKKITKKSNHNNNNSNNKKLIKKKKK